MKWPVLGFLLLTALARLVDPAGAAEPTERTANPPAEPSVVATHPPAKATLKDLAWLPGHWLGEGLGGVAEEVWLPERGGAMLGTFRSLRDGKVGFYEILTISPNAEGSLELRLKHFDADLKGWEERDRFLSFLLTRAEDGLVAFGPILFRRPGPDELEVVVGMKQQDGSRRDESFLFRRVR